MKKKISKDTLTGGQGNVRVKKTDGSESRQESDHLLRSVVQGFSIPAFVIGKDHKVIYWNRALEQLSKIPMREVVGTNRHWKAFYAEERPCMADLLIDGVTERIPKWYEGKYTKSSLLEDAYEATDFFPDLGKKAGGSASLRRQSAIRRASSWAPLRRWRTSRNECPPSCRDGKANSSCSV